MLAKKRGKEELSSNYPYPYSLTPASAAAAAVLSASSQCGVLCCHFLFHAMYNKNTEESFASFSL